MKTFSRLIPAVVLVASLVSAARAQTAVVSSKSADDLLSSARALVVTTLGETGQAQPILTMLDQMTGPDMLKGLDRTKPMGAYSILSANLGEKPNIVVLLPVTSEKDFLDLLGRFGVPTEAVKGTKGVTHSITAPGLPMPLYGRFEGGYAAFSTIQTGPPVLANLKPATVFATATAPLTAKFSFDQIPPATKQVLLAAMFQNPQALAEREKKPGETEETYNARIAGINLFVDANTALFRDGKDLTLSLNVDPKKGDLSIDLTTKALPKTAVAGAFQAFGSKSSLFRTIGAGSSGSAFARLPIAESIRKVFAANVAKGREEAAKSQGDPGDVALSNEIFDLVEPLLTGPELDFGAAVFGPFAASGEKSKYAGLFALKVADGARVDKVLRELAVKANKEKPAGIEKVTLDVAKSADGKTAIHKIVLSGGPADMLARFGEPIVHLTTTMDAVILAVGAKGLEPLKKAVGSMGAAPTPGAPQVQAQASIASILPLTADDPQAESKLIEELKANKIFQGPDAKRDTGTLRVLGTADSFSIQLKLDGPALKFLASMGIGSNVKPPGR